MGADYGTARRLRTIPERVRAGCYLDLGGGVEDTTLVVGTGRSGSTWVAEIINYRNEYRMVFEPFRSDRVRKARSIRRGNYIDPRDQDHPLAKTIDDLLEGRVRSFWTDRQNRKRLATRRIVKAVRLTNLLPWIRARHPALRIAYVVRDPLAVARSWLELGWGDDLDDLISQEQLLERLPGTGEVIREVVGNGSPFERHILRWCLENAIPMQQSAELDIHLVAYEQLKASPEHEVACLFAYLGRQPADGVDVRRPSATAGFPRRTTVHVTEEQERSALAITSAFDISRHRGA